jgi:CubicO group peptidase (beta-lactamase class C family)
MRHSLVLRFTCAIVFGPLLAAQAPTTAYFPDRFDWQKKRPDEVGMDGPLVDAAVKLAIAGETPGTHDTRQFLEQSFGGEPNHGLIGPVQDRGGACGVVVHGGYLVAEWGDTHRADMCNSVTKTFLTTVVGLAWQHGRIHDVHDTVRPYMPAGVELFTAPHNQPITWEYLLRQTSDWQGELWGKQDWEDRPEGKSKDEWPHRKLWEPGAHYKYNDVRVNVLALAALQVWRRPLPEVLREQIMDPIGASSTWRWCGYDNSWVEIDGSKVQSVSGGGHWGGGMFIDAFDLARFGLLFLRNGKWKEQQLVSPEWIAMARTPGSDNKVYGYANWFLNTDQKPLPSAPASAVRFVGNGANVVYIDWEHDLVAVVRWIRSDKALDEVVGKLIESLAPAKAK